jgi:MFS family permease
MVFSGMFISAVFWGTIADKYGRRPTLILTSVFLCYFGFLVSFRHHFTGMGS